MSEIKLRGFWDESSDGLFNAGVLVILPTSDFFDELWESDACGQWSNKKDFFSVAKRLGIDESEIEIEE